MEYPAGFVVYTMGKTGFLQGLAEDVDLARSRGMAVAHRNVGGFLGHRHRRDLPMDWCLIATPNGNALG